jgi:hypothetical protein
MNESVNAFFQRQKARGTITNIKSTGSTITPIQDTFKKYREYGSGKVYRRRIIG